MKIDVVQIIHQKVHLARFLLFCFLIDSDRYPIQTGCAQRELNTHILEHPIRQLALGRAGCGDSDNITKPWSLTLSHPWLCFSSSVVLFSDRFSLHGGTMDIICSGMTWSLQLADTVSPYSSSKSLMDGSVWWYLTWVPNPKHWPWVPGTQLTRN